MNINIVSFTRKGSQLCRDLTTALSAEHNCKGYSIEKFSIEYQLEAIESLSSWTKEMFRESDALVFVGACGIAVRSIAPYIRDKTIDPAVIVVDELGSHVIPILSGHIGGANDLAVKISSITGGIPIISTATDINGRFSVDSFAVKNSLYISDMTVAKSISAKVLEGEKIGFSCDGDVRGKIHSDLTRDGAEIGINISIYNDEPCTETLHLIPRIVSLGIGCRKGVPVENIEALANRVLRENSISLHSIENICSINIKKDEVGLIEFARKVGVEFLTYTPEELNSAVGEFTESSFVKGITGVDNVCERAAMLGSSGELIIRKTCENGVTIAVAIKKWGIDFEN